ncbi:MauE/DoxX family redox-associated membrane protein [Halolamina sp.]|uniref:DoxX family protein n=1 Tax=Halolamina sp. TaxID=1940283 RepID=UPI0035638B54
MATTLARLKHPLCYLMGSLYVVAGIAHFLAPNGFAQIVPPWLPNPLALVYLSGIAEIVLGLGVLHPRTRKPAAWGLIALLLAVFPANIYMATSGVVVQDAATGTLDPSPLVRWGRLPLQAVLIAWAWWYTGE